MRTGRNFAPVFTAISFISGFRAPALHSQTPLHFTTVSLRLSIERPGPANRPSTQIDAGDIECHLITPQALIRMAYPLEDYQLVWPAWMTWMKPPATSRPPLSTGRGPDGLLVARTLPSPPGQIPYYDLSATMPPETTPEQRQWMLQSMLAASLRMSPQGETRDMRFLTVVVAPGGLKIRKLPDSGD